MTGPNADLIPNALKGLNFGSLTSAAIPAAVGGAASPIIVNAAGRAASNLAGSAVGGALGQAAASQIGAPKQGNVVDGVDQDTGDIVVSKYRPISPPGGYAPIPILGATAFPTGSILYSLGPLNTLPSDPALMQPETLPEDIVVTGMESLTPDEILLALGGVGGLAAATAGGAATDPAAAEKAKADAETKKKLGLEEYLRIAGLASGLIGGAAGGGSGGSGTYGGSGTGRLNPIFSAKLPSAGGLGSIGMNRTQRPMGDVDWLTYGTRPELSFFDYAPRTALPTPAALPTPVTQPVPNNPAGPIMAERDPMRFAKGGRSEFAVNGAGTGRSDDIPAVLSDGEYVIDAETVALLGDGSNKAGAKKLDELRVKVRKHKGQKLAKGRFSANAKKPEAYLSGGRI